MIIAGYGLVLLLAALGTWLQRSRGWHWTGNACVFLAGLALSATVAGPHILDGVQTGVNGISTGIQQATSR